MVNKSILRNKYRQIRRDISDKSVKDGIILNRLLSDELLKGAELVLIYASTSEEVDTENLSKLLISSKRIAFPKVEGEDIVFYEIENLKDLKPGYFGILEPTSHKKVDNFIGSICIVPAICFDKKGFRIGYGRGFYDRFLNNYLGYSIGICYRECLVDNVNPDNFDIRVNKIITD